MTLVNPRFDLLTAFCDLELQLFGHCAQSSLPTPAPDPADSGRYHCVRGEITVVHEHERASGRSCSARAA